MNLSITVYNRIREVVKFFWKRLQLDRQLPTTGRHLKLHPCDALAAGLLKQRQNIETKKAIYELLEPDCSYKTFVVSINRWAKWAGLMLALVLRMNRADAHLVKHIDSTDIPVCLNKNARRHKTMRMFADWGKTGKGWFYGLKLHLTSDLKRRVLAVTFTSGNRADATVFLELNHDLRGVFLADAAYTGEALAREFHQEHRRWLLARPRKNMKKLRGEWTARLYATRMMVEWNFRSLKMSYGIVTSLPRSINGYLTHYVYALTAFVLG